MSPTSVACLRVEEQPLYKHTVTHVKTRAACAMGNYAASAQTAPHSSATTYKAQATALSSSTPPPCTLMSKKVDAGNKGCWEFRFFTRVRAAGGGALQQSLELAREVTGVDLGRSSRLGFRG